MQPSDRAWRERGLKEAVLAGDERAWRTLYDEAYAGLYAYVHWRCGGGCATSPTRWCRRPG
jgi:hypothetical protein